MKNRTVRLEISDAGIIILSLYEGNVEVERHPYEALPDDCFDKVVRDWLTNEE